MIAALASVGLNVASSVASTRAANKAKIKQNEQVLASLGRSLGDAALQQHQQQQQIREASIAVRKQGKEMSGATRAMALASDTFGDSVNEQQLQIDRDAIENQLRLQQSSANTLESFDRVVQGTIQQHKAQLQQLGSSGIVEGLASGVGAGIQNGSINQNTLGNISKGITNARTSISQGITNARTNFAGLLGFGSTVTPA